MSAGCQVRRILQSQGQALPISVSCIQSPVFYGNAQVAHLGTLLATSLEEVRSELEPVVNIYLIDENYYSTPVGDAFGSNYFGVGYMRDDYVTPEIVQFWLVSDNNHLDSH